MLLALSLGLVWALCRRSRLRSVSWPVAGAVEFVRSTPLLIQLYFVYYVLPDFGIILDPWLAGVIALGIHFSTYTSEVYRAGIDGIPQGQWLAARALNLKKLQTYRYVIIPQAIPPVVPALGNYLVAMFKVTPMLSAITVLEVLQRAKNLGNEHFRYLEPLTIVGSCIFCSASWPARWSLGLNDGWHENRNLVLPADSSRNTKRTVARATNHSNSAAGQELRRAAGPAGNRLGHRAWLEGVHHRAERFR